MFENGRKSHSELFLGKKDMLEGNDLSYVLSDKNIQTST